jgi:hypothetical protein
MKKIIMLFILSGLIMSGLGSQNSFSIPYHENFDNAADTNYWHSYNLNNDDGNWFWADQNYGNFGYQNSYCYAYIYSFMNAGDDWLVSPGLKLNAGISYSISFMYAEFDSTMSEKLKAVVGNDSLPGIFSYELVDLDSFHNDSYLKAEYTFTPDTTGTYFLKFYAYSDVNQGAILIDEIDVSVQSSNIPFIQDANEINIYPNPASDELHIEKGQGYYISISDPLGKEVYTGRLDSEEKMIDLQMLKKGLYFIRLIKGDHTSIRKILIQ